MNTLPPHQGAPATYLLKAYSAGVHPPREEGDTLRALEALNEVEWIDLISDAFAETAAANELIGAWGGASYAARLSILVGRLAPDSKRLAAQACSRMLDTGAAELPDMRLRTLEFLGRVRHSQASDVLKLRLRDPERMIREAAADALANAQTEPARFWAGLDYSLHPEWAPAAIAALAELQPKWGLRVLVRLPQIDVEDIRGSVEYLVRKANETTGGREALATAKLHAPPWLRSLLPIGDAGRPGWFSIPPYLAPTAGLFVATVLLFGVHHRAMGLAAVLAILALPIAFFGKSLEAFVRALLNRPSTV